MISNGVFTKTTIFTNCLKIIFHPIIKNTSWESQIEEGKVRSYIVFDNTYNDSEPIFKVFHFAVRMQVTVANGMLRFFAYFQISHNLNHDC